MRLVRSYQRTSSVYLYKSVGGLLLVPLTAYLISLVGWRMTWGVPGLLVLVLVLPVAFVLRRDGFRSTPM